MYVFFPADWFLYTGFPWESQPENIWWLYSFLLTDFFLARPLWRNNCIWIWSVDCHVSFFWSQQLIFFLGRLSFLRFSEKTELYSANQGVSCWYRTQRSLTPSQKAPIQFSPFSFHSVSICFPQVPFGVILLFMSQSSAWYVFMNLQLKLCTCVLSSVLCSLPYMTILVCFQGMENSSSTQELKHHTLVSRVLFIRAF